MSEAKLDDLSDRDSFFLLQKYRGLCRNKEQTEREIGRKEERVKKYEEQMAEVARELNSRDDDYRVTNNS